MLVVDRLFYMQSNRPFSYLKKQHRSFHLIYLSVAEYVLNLNHHHNFCQ